MNIEIYAENADTEQVFKLKKIISENGKSKYIIPKDIGIIEEGNELIIHIHYIATNNDEFTISSYTHNDLIKIIKIDEED